MTAGHEPVYSVTPLAERQATLDELFRGKMAQPIRSADDLACDGILFGELDGGDLDVAGL